MSMAAVTNYRFGDVKLMWLELCDVCLHVCQTSFGLLLVVCVRAQNHFRIEFLPRNCTHNWLSENKLALAFRLMMVQDIRNDNKIHSENTATADE